MTGGSPLWQEKCQNAVEAENLFCKYALNEMNFRNFFPTKIKRIGCWQEITRINDVDEATDMKIKNNEFRFRQSLY